MKDEVQPHEIQELGRYGETLITLFIAKGRSGEYQIVQIVELCPPHPVFSQGTRLR